ncbi:uncharacterized protein EV154DRAFT_488870 [Mucor mucedo]|uniref:uncharacterized protein n=1 Tax=Mucor mucedo TaxID=29922 RepID=UPI0022204160|nr:uncharacterized protein EV154DRAFT_488870 [Mucor mucedo]KAI7864635.1 hypothetical protein EV154DRAFT_488870 [Mucor mucedo]
MTHLCDVCKTEFQSSAKLDNHNYDVHVNTLQVSINNKTSVVQRVDAEKKRSFQTDEDSDTSSIVIEHRKIPGPHLSLDEFNPNSLTLPSLRCDDNTKVAVTSSKQEKTGFSNTGDRKPVEISSKCEKKFYMLASPETIEHLLVEQPTGLWWSPSPVK